MIRCTVVVAGTTGETAVVLVVVVLVTSSSSSSKLMQPLVRARAARGESQTEGMQEVEWFS